MGGVGRNRPIVTSFTDDVRHYSGIFAHLLHIRPWEIETHMTLEQFEDLRAWVDDYMRQQRQAASKGGE